MPALIHRILQNSRFRQALIGLVCVGVLLAVLSMYLRPEFLLTLADQVWGCF
jgi:hypothetical protein